MVFPLLATKDVRIRLHVSGRACFVKRLLAMALGQGIHAARGPKLQLKNVNKGKET